MVKGFIMEYRIYSGKVLSYHILLKLFNYHLIRIMFNYNRLKICAVKLLNDIPQAKREGYDVCNYSIISITTLIIILISN